MDDTRNMKRCPKCGVEKPVREFSRNRARSDGLQTWCKECLSEYQRGYLATAAGKQAKSRYENSEKSKQVKAHYSRSKKGKQARSRYSKSAKGRRAFKRARITYNDRYPERHNARAAVGRAVATGKIPAAKTLTCECGMPATSYHHHLGYEKEHWLDVIPFCRDCHQAADRQQEVSVT